MLNDNYTYYDFDDYLTHIFEKLNQAHPSAPNSFIQEIGPKKTKHKSKRGILLIHGLLDSCSTMNSLYDAFKKQNLEIINLLLPGHGTAPSDLMHVKAKAWKECVRIGIAGFSELVEDITIVGLSTGAVLAALLAPLYPKVKRLILFAPAIKLHSLYKIPQTIPYMFFSLYPSLLKNIWLKQSAENNPVKYESVTLNGIFQLLKLSHELDNIIQQKELKIPVLSILSYDDETISCQAAINFTLKQTNQYNQVLLYKNCTNYTCSNNKIGLYTSNFPNMKIINFSHVCMHISPNHPYFGKKSSQTNFYLGAYSKKNILNYPNKFQRLTFNPHFDKLFNKLMSFLDVY